MPGTASAQLSSAPHRCNDAHVVVGIYYLQYIYIYIYCIYCLSHQQRSSSAACIRFAAHARDFPGSFPGNCSYQRAQLYICKGNTHTHTHAHLCALPGHILSASRCGLCYVCADPSTPSRPAPLPALKALNAALKTFG